MDIRLGPDSGQIKGQAKSLKALADYYRPGFKTNLGFLTRAIENNEASITRKDQMVGNYSSLTTSWGVKFRANT